jgi:hypothetical protein
MSHMEPDLDVLYMDGNFKKLPMEPVSGPNSSGVDGNRMHKLTSRICSGAAPLFWPDGPCIQLESIRDAS